MSFFVSEDIKDRITENDFSSETSHKWDAFAVSSGKAYKIIQYVPKNDGCVVNLEVSGMDLIDFIRNEFVIDYIEISSEQFKIKSQSLIKFKLFDNTNTYITENYLRSQ